MPRFFVIAIMMLAACAQACVPSAQPQSPQPPPQVIVVQSPTQGGEQVGERGGSSSANDAPTRFGAIDVRDAAGATQTYHTTEITGEHYGHTIPTDTAGDTVSITSGAMHVGDGTGPLTVDGTVTVTDGSGAMNVIVDSSALPTGAAAEGTLASLASNFSDVRHLDGESYSSSNAGVAPVYRAVATPTAPAGGAGTYSEPQISSTTGETFVKDSTAGGYLLNLESRTPLKYFEEVPLSAINSGTDTSSAVLNLAEYKEVWFEVEASVTATGTIEIWGALTSGGTTTLVGQRGIPIYDVISPDMCTHADGDSLISIDYTSGGGNEICLFRVPAPPPYVVVRWDQASGGGATGLTVRAFGRSR